MIGKKKIGLDMVVRDRVTGFQGLTIAKTEWLNGCVRFLVQPQELKDGRPIEADWIDEQQIEIIEDKKKEEPKPTGGPQKDPKSSVSNNPKM